MSLTFDPMTLTLPVVRHHLPDLLALWRPWILLTYPTTQNSTGHSVITTNLYHLLFLFYLGGSCKHTYTAVYHKEDERWFQNSKFGEKYPSWLWLSNRFFQNITINWISLFEYVIIIISLFSNFYHYWKFKFRIEISILTLIIK